LLITDDVTEYVDEQQQQNIYQSNFDLCSFI